MPSRNRIPVACGVDIGSTNLKVVALDSDGTVVARSSRETVRDAATSSIDVAILFDCVEQMIAEVCADRCEVHAVCTVGVGEDGVLVDDQFRPLSQALSWFDPSRKRIFDSFAAQLSADNSCDAAIDQERTLVGWAWAASRVSRDSARAWIALTDFAGVVWSGRPFLSDTLASRTGAWRSRDRAWVRDRVDLTLGSVDLLPRIVSAGDIVGDLVSARLSGVVAADAITVAGGHDHPIGGWGVRQGIPGAIVDSMGTAEVIVAQSAQPGLARDRHIDVAPGIAEPGSSLLRVEELSRNAQWAAAQDPAVERGIRALLAGEARPAPVLDAGYFTPGKRGGGMPSYAPDVPVDPLVRASAVLGALAHLGRDAVDVVRGRVSERSEIRLTGGWARSPGWLEIKSAVNGYTADPIREPEVPAVAAALLAARARGWNPDPVRALAGSAG